MDVYECGVCGLFHCCGDYFLDRGTVAGQYPGARRFARKTGGNPRGNTAAAYLQNVRANVVAVKTMDAAYAALLAGQVDAIVFDAPVLWYYATQQGQGRVTIVGTTFQKESYAIALPSGSPYREAINAALLQIREDGTYATLYKVW
jgi:ABC-type amino acid transport substrate-binding protein